MAAILVPKRKKNEATESSSGEHTHSNINILNYLTADNNGNLLFKGKIVGERVINTETHSITSNDITKKSFTLANTIRTGEEKNTLLHVSGIAQIFDIDYCASGNSISWNNKNLDNIDLRPGDVFVIKYVT